MASNEVGLFQTRSLSNKVFDDEDFFEGDKGHLKKKLSSLKLSSSHSDRDQLLEKVQKFFFFSLVVNIQAASPDFEWDEADSRTEKAHHILLIERLVHAGRRSRRRSGWPSCSRSFDEGISMQRPFSLTSQPPGLHRRASTSFLALGSHHVAVVRLFGSFFLIAQAKPAFGRVDTYKKLEKLGGVLAMPSSPFFHAC